MVKEKIFSSEDFDKDPKVPKNNKIKWVIAVIVIVVAIVAVVLGLRGCDSDNQSQNSENPQTGVVTDSNMIVDSVINIESDSVASNDSKIEESTYNEVEVSNENQSSKTESEDPEKISNTRDVPSDIEAEALKVIRGDYGNNPQRKSNLGNQYQPIQDRVNELKRQGVF